MNEYNNIVALLLSALFFTAFDKIRLPTRMGRVVLILSPSVFAIYLIHQPIIGFETRVVKWLADMGSGIYAAYFAAALTVFFLALAVDLPRRVAAWLMRPILVRAYALIDGCYDSVLAWIDGGLGKIGSES